MQDWSSGEVLTLAYMNEEALRLTRETGEVHFFSRSRDELWRKGETSGNVQRLRQLRYDCDGDALVALVEPAGPGLPHRRALVLLPRLDGAADRRRTPPASTASPSRPPTRRSPALERTLAERRDERPEGSYTVELLADPERIGDEGARGGRRGRARRARTSPTSASPRRPPTCSTTSRSCCSRATSRSRPPWRPSMAVAAEPEPGSNRARPRGARSGRERRPGRLPVHRRLRDAGLGVPQAARGVRRARRSCSSRPSRAGSAATRSSAFARRSSCAGQQGRLT